MKVQVCNKEIQVELKKHSQRRKVALEILSQTEFLLKTPKRFSQKDATNFFIFHKEQIKNFYLKFLSQTPQKVETNFREVSLFGEKIKVEFLETEFRERVIFEENLLKVYGKNENLKELLTNFYIKKAKEIFTLKVSFYSQKMNLQVNKIFIKNQKSRWGSCSVLGNINLNWRLLFAPEKIIDYVIVHELCHLKEMNHSKKFWELVGKEIPNYKESRIWLLQNGKLLNF
ncbi:M48 family metallopeptidase [bacterium]|nr:M48 family metallopeptidase [bacterium]